MTEAVCGAGRFTFIKDTTCSVSAMRRKLEILHESQLHGSKVKLFNANAATLLPSIRMGVSGYSGVMANFHPELYVELWNRREDTGDDIELLAAYLSFASVIERQYYPLNALYFLSLAGLPITPASRRSDWRGFTESMRREVDHFYLVNSRAAEEVGTTRRSGAEHPNS